jgi:hypothetical protein
MPIQSATPLPSTLREPDVDKVAVRANRAVSLDLLGVPA